MSKNSKVTLKDISERVNKSIATVSLALAGSDKIQEKTRQEIQHACLELGYRTKEEISARLNGHIIRSKIKRFCLLVIGGNPWQDLGSYLDALFEEAPQFNARLEVVKIDSELDLITAKIEELRKEVDGIILANLVDAHAYQQVADLNFPCVMAGSIINRQNLTHTRHQLTCVDYDVTQMARFAVNTLVKKGHRQIAFICQPGPKGLYYSRWSDGYMLGIQDHSLAYDPDLCPLKSLADTDHFDDLFRQICSKTNPPTAFIVPGPYWLIPCLAIAKELNLEFGPGNIIVGGSAEQFKNLKLSNTTYPYITPDCQAFAYNTIMQLDLQTNYKQQQGLYVLTPFECHHFDKLKSI